MALAFPADHHRIRCGRVGYVSTASSYLSASDKRVHFGLGSDARIREIELKWPSGIVQRLTTFRRKITFSDRLRVSSQVGEWCSAGDLPPSLPQERGGTAAPLTHGSPSIHFRC